MIYLSDFNGFPSKILKSIQIQNYFKFTNYSIFFITDILLKAVYSFYNYISLNISTILMSKNCPFLISNCYLQYH